MSEKKSCANLEGEESGRSRTNPPPPPEKSIFSNLRSKTTKNVPRTPWQSLISLGATNPHPRNFFFNPRKDITFVAKSSSTRRLVIARYDWLTKIYLNIEFRISIDPPGRAFLQTISTRIIAVLLGWPSSSC